MQFQTFMLFSNFYITSLVLMLFLKDLFVKTFSSKKIHFNFILSFQDKKIQNIDQLFSNKMMSQGILIILLVLVVIQREIQASIYQPLDELVEQKYVDESEVIRLANQQKFWFPINGRYISYKIKYWPQNGSDCVFRQASVEYKRLEQTTKLFDEDDQVIGHIVLKRSQKIIVADPYFNIVVYSTDEHNLLRLLSPKTSLIIERETTTEKQMVNTLAMITTQQEDFIYYLSPQASFVFPTNSFGTQIDQLDVEIPQIQKALYFKGYVVVLSADEGVFVYKLNKKTHHLTKLQTIINLNQTIFIDIQLDYQNQLFYILTSTTIQLYLFQPSDFPNPHDQKEFIILKPQDQILLINHTTNHASVMENNQHLNLQIAVTQTNTEIFVLFRHLRQNVIAEFLYHQIKKQVTFLRYFKFQMQIKQIHTIKDVIVVVGEDILGMFPFGIDPRLITEEFNGWMTLSNIVKIAITDPPYFVGITKNSIQYGGLLFSRDVGLNCEFNDSTLTKKIIFEGNLTWCNNEEHSYNQYCSYSKKFVLEPMDIVTTSTVSSTIWTVIFICTVVIILGIFIVFIMHKKKQEEIKKLQLYFEERRRIEIPASSDRRAQTEDRM